MFFHYLIIENDWRWWLLVQSWPEKKRSRGEFEDDLTLHSQRKWEKKERSNDALKVLAMYERRYFRVCKFFDKYTHLFYSFKNNVKIFLKLIFLYKNGKLVIWFKVFIFFFSITPIKTNKYSLFKNTHLINNFFFKYI